MCVVGTKVWISLHTQVHKYLYWDSRRHTRTLPSSADEEASIEPVTFHETRNPPYVYKNQRAHKTREIERQSK